MKNYISLFIKISIIFLILTITYPFILSVFFEESTDKGTFGDSFGALNSIFSGIALCGIIVSLIMQQSEMKLQRDEMIASRYEYSHNRITNLVYSQLSKFEKSIENIHLSNMHQAPSGSSAIFFLEKKLINIYNYKENREDQLKEAVKQKKDINHNYQILLQCSSDLAPFIITTYNCLNALSSILKKGNIEENDKEELFEVFINNIGDSLIIVINNIETTLHFVLEYTDELGINKEYLQKEQNIKAINFYISELRNFLNK
ncbi:hypothetical protein [Empedobacter sp. ULE_I140]